MSVLFVTIPPKRLSFAITSASSTFILNNIKSFDGENNVTAADLGTQAYGAFRNDTGTVLEIFEYDPATLLAGGAITFLKRGLNFYGNRTLETTSLKLDWPVNSIVQLGTDVPQIFQYLKEYIDAASIVGAVPSSTTAAGIVVEGSLGEIQAGTTTKTISAVAYKLFAPLDKLKTWITSFIASDSAYGFSEEATVAEITAGTGAGATGARLFINPTSTVSVSAGAGDVGKVPRLNAAGLMDKTFNESFTTCVTRPVSLETAIPNAGAITQNNVLFGAQLVYIPAQITISQATFDVTVVGGNFTMHLALYSYDGQTRILNSSLAITASGRRTLTFGAVTIPAGFYYEGIILGGSGVANQTYWRWNVGDTTTLIMNATSGKNPYFGTFAVTANTLPVTFTPSTLSTASGLGHPLFRYD